MTEVIEYYPNKEGLTDEDGKLYKYVYANEGFKNKRRLHEHMVRTFLNESANKEIDNLIEGGIIKLGEVYPDDTDSQLRSKLNVGFFNRTTKQVHYDLIKLAEEISSGDSIQVIVFNMPFGQVSSLGGFALTSTHLNSAGEAIIGEHINSYDNTITEDPLQEDEKEETSRVLSGQISTDPLA